MGALRPEDGVESPGAGVIDGCEFLKAGTDIKPRFESTVSQAPLLYLNISFKNWIYYEYGYFARVLVYAPGTCIYRGQKRPSDTWN